MPSYYPYTLFSHAAGNHIDIDPKVLVLPEEGMAEYVTLADCHHKPNASGSSPNGSATTANPDFIAAALAAIAISVWCKDHSD